jgi:branched-chain amino acid transport system substrate-binding protein
MQKPFIPIGLVFSQSGPYAVMAGEMLKSAVMRSPKINQSDEFDFTFAPSAGSRRRCRCSSHRVRHLIREEHVDHIVGCYTSASRQQVIPVLERTERLLRYPARYEGFERSDNVIYVGAAPNQHRSRPPRCRKSSL